MRNLLSRLTPNEPVAPSLRERLTGYRARLAAARAKAGQVVAVNRALFAPLPPPAPRW